MAEVEQQIVDAAGRGDFDAVARLLLDHYEPLIRAHLRSLVAEAAVDDLTQITIIATVTALKQGRFKRRSSLATYVRKIAKNRAWHHRDSFWEKLFRHARPVGPDEDHGGVDPPAPVPEEAPPEMSLEDLWAIFAEKERIALKMWLEGMDTPQMARCMETSEANIYKIRSRAFAKARNHLKTLRSREISSERRASPD